MTLLGMILDIVAEEQFLVAQVQAAVGDDWTRPDLAARQAQRRFLWDREFARLGPPLGRSLRQHDRSILLAITIEMAVRTGQRAGPEPPVRPDDFAGHELHANPAFIV